MDRLKIRTILSICFVVVTWIEVVVVKVLLVYLQGVIYICRPFINYTISFILIFLYLLHTFWIFLRIQNILCLILWIIITLIIKFNINYIIFLYHNCFFSILLKNVIFKIAVIISFILNILCFYWNFTILLFNHLSFIYFLCID